MNVHEYQGKEILRAYGVPVPDFRIVKSVEEAKKAIDELGLTSGVVKIQVHAGGRGKAGGVKLGKTKEELLGFAKDLIGMKIVNNQTGPEGVIAHEVMITPALEIAQEYYLGAIVDRDRAGSVLIASPEGGVEIEEVAEKTPEKIMTIPITIDGRVRGYHLVALAKFMGWSKEQAKQGRKIAQAVAKAFVESDASLLEINPLVATPEGEIFALDAKLGIDDNALYRQKKIAEMFDPTQVSAKEVEAKEFDLSYVALDGNIGCMVNGAGLAMATMDIIHHYGGEPANFLDVGGSATEEQVAEAFKIILSDPKVKGVLVNIFGGIMNCATLAKGIVHAAEKLHVQVPLVVRMEGTNVDEGKRILSESSLSIVSADSLTEAAEKVTAELRG